MSRLMTFFFYWVTAKEQLLNNPAALLSRLMTYDKDNIPERLINAVAPLVQSEDFTPKKIAGASQACAAMCQWTHAMVKYHEVSKKVAPLRQRLAVAQADNKVYQEKLAAAQARLAEVEAKLARLQADKTKAENDMQVLEHTVKMTEIKLGRAAMLIDGLAGEKKNWMRTVETLTDKSRYLTGDMLAAAGQISYVGAFTSIYRNALLDQWRQKMQELGILHSAQVSVFHTLQDPIQTRSWTLHSLPGDTLSIENAIFLTNARRWPLMIDPQTQANKWIRDTYGDQLEVVKPSNKDMIKRIEHCIRAGRPVLLENVSQDIDPSLDPLLTKQTFMQGGQEMIRISENPVPWSHDFKFFMTTKLINPHYIPEIMVKVTLLNFFITPAGLEDQLLGVVVGQERKELELRKNDLVQKNAEMKAEIADIQKTILRKLEEVQGDILDDEELIKYLDQSKIKTTEINIRVADAEVTEKEIDETREGYRPIAYHSSILYFCCATLANVDPMYQYSLQWFVQLFISGIEAAERSEDLAERLESLKNFFSYSFYQNISRSLFEKHKLMFSFVLCVRLLQGQDLLAEDEYRFVLQGPSIIITGAKNPAPEWLTDVVWTDLIYLDKTFPAFNGFCDHVAANVEHYRRVFMSSMAHREPYHGEWDKKLTILQKMMFIRCLRPDKLMEAVQDFVSFNLGDKFIKPPPFDLATSFKDSSPMTPLIFVLSPGADPFEEWKKFAETQRMGKKLSDISLGQGQGPRAERLMREGMENGMWVLLQNCHLATSWMSSLERLVENFAVGMHPSFRLWLTSMPNPSFPVIILQNGIKMTNEPPKGLRANLARSIMSYPNDFLEKCKKAPEFKKLFFSMCFFHALIQERRKFGPLGWNIPYEYTSGDLSCCVVQCQMFLDKYDEVPYKVIKELSGNIHYGGRVTDDWDRRTLMTILDGFVCPDVLKEGYAFSSSGNYGTIAPTDQKGYMEYIESWPLNIQPEAFGLHDNADITCARNETFETLAAIVLLQGEATKKSAGAKSPDEIVSDLAVAILQKVRPPFDMAAFQKRFPTKYEDSMNTVVVQEAIRFNKLVNVVRNTLEAIPLAVKGLVVMSKELEEVYKAAVKGLVVMSKELEEVYKAMLINTVPTMWADRAYPSLKPLAAWVSDLVQRLQMIERWFDLGHPKTYWISGFFFPQAFLTGILQNYARKQQISIDTISYGFEWLNKNPEECKEAPSTPTM
ncbi:dynein heavy chain, putative [Bodo saltans]|uniref:Dynein heavy chain, putative n=1 Tax=Bodo saltans TaxID=75058 RepID=A0A0S4J7Z6_BODSA|nr:dynein heavy chain, putative [Bodo saltans]|eukprot:CUG87356.1 dynein heavy chain, putative [Bodo saltans]